MTKIDYLAVLCNLFMKDSEFDEKKCTWTSDTRSMRDRLVSKWHIYCDKNKLSCKDELLNEIDSLEILFILNYRYRIKHPLEDILRAVMVARYAGEVNNNLLAEKIYYEQ